MHSEPCTHCLTQHRYSLPGQSHFYMETQVSVAEPLEDGCMRIHSGTQSLDAVQASVAGVLGEPFHKITVGELLFECDAKRQDYN